MAQGFAPMSSREMATLRSKCSSTAADGRFGLYKVSLKLDDPETRRQHGFPLDMQEAEVKERLECARTENRLHTEW